MASQVFTVYNLSEQRLDFDGFSVAPKRSTKTVAANVMNSPKVWKARLEKMIVVQPNPEKFYENDSAVPVLDVQEVVDAVIDAGGGGGGGSPGTATALVTRTLINDGIQVITRGMPVCVLANGRMVPARGTLAERGVVGLCASNAVAQNELGVVVIEGNVTADAAEWQVITGEVGGLVRDRKYFLDFSVPGRLSQPNISLAIEHSYLVSVGYALSPAEFKIEIQPAVRIA